MNTLSQTFSALGEPTRLAIVERLLLEGELSAGQLVAEAQVSAPAISRHLKVLRNAGVIRQRVHKHYRYYSVNAQSVDSIRSWVEDNEVFWNQSMDKLAGVLKSTTSNG